MAVNYFGGFCVKQFYIVDSSILPDVGWQSDCRNEPYSKMVKLNRSRGQLSKLVFLAVPITGDTKDYVFLPDHEMASRKGGHLINAPSRSRYFVRGFDGHIACTRASIVTINQNIPIHNWASVVISFDISAL